MSASGAISLSFEPKRKPRLDYLLVLAAFAAFTVWYMSDAARASTRVENLALIIPAGVLSLVLLAGLAIHEVALGGTSHEPGLVRARSPWLMVLAVTGFVAGIEPLGFTPSTVAFLAVALPILGERRPLVVAFYALVLGIGLGLLFSQLATIPAPFWDR